jgi:hypothetical protein
MVGIVVRGLVMMGNAAPELEEGDRARDQMRDVLWCSSLSQKLCFRNPLKLLFLRWKCFFLLYELQDRLSKYTKLSL